MKILIIDDDDLIREIAKLTLEQAGLTVVCAEGGEAGVAIAASSCPDAILLDWQMPGWDGEQTLAALRAAPELSAIPVVVLSAGAKDRQAHLLEQGAVATLEKPFEVEHLARQVLAALAGQGA